MRYQRNTGFPVRMSCTFAVIWESRLKNNCKDGCYDERLWKMILNRLYQFSTRINLILIVMSDKNFVDYCPSIKPGDEKFRTVQLLL